MFQSVARITITVLLLGLSFPATAQDSVHPELSSKYSLDLGLFFPERDIQLKAGVTAPGARRIDFGSEFGLKKHDQMFAVDFKWRFGEKWSLAAQHFSASAAATVLLGEDVEWNGLVFDSGTNIEANSEFALYRVFFGRSLAKTDDVDFGFGAGIHWLDMTAAIAGSILVNNTVTFRRETVKSSAPLPNIGGWYDHSLSPRWAIKARADWFKANIDEYDGRLVNLQVGVNYAWFRHGGIGVAYNHFEFDAGVNSSNWRGAADLTFKGPYAFVNIYW
jgi:hypothetical protein